MNRRPDRSAVRCRRSCQPPNHTASHPPAAMSSGRMNQKKTAGPVIRSAAPEDALHQFVAQAPKKSGRLSTECPPSPALRLTVRVPHRRAQISRRQSRRQTRGPESLPEASYVRCESGSSACPGTNARRTQTLVILKSLGGGYRNRTGLHGFAIRCVTSPPTRPSQVRPGLPRRSGVGVQGGLRRRRAAGRRRSSQMLRRSGLAHVRCASSQ